MDSINKIKGMVYDIQRFSLHDGPGIRTVVFFKGCPLRCQWCANPESQRSDIEEMNNRSIGKIMSVNQIIDHVLRDQAFYAQSGGGLTISGGEPLMQDLFLNALIDAAKKNNIHIAIETSGYQSWQKIEHLIKKIDLVLYDLKAYEDDLHKLLTGYSNKEIMSNLKHLSELDLDIIVRIPVIPNKNDSWENLLRTCQYVDGLGIKHIDLLPYHRLGEIKYTHLKRNYLLKGTKPYNKSDLEKVAIKLSSEIKAEIKVV